MASIPVESLQEGTEDSFVLVWPPQSPRDQDPYAALAFVVMKRASGLLVGLPVGFLPVDVLQGATLAGEDSLVGPHTTITVPGVRYEDAGPVQTGEDVEVQLVDFSTDIIVGLERFADSEVPEDRLASFGSDISIVPEAEVLVRYAADWIALAGGQRAAFYSAEELPEGEVQAPTTAKQQAKAKEKPKRQSVAQVTASHLSTMAQLLPAMADQLKALQENQVRMQAELLGKAALPPPRPSQMPATMSPQDFANVVGAPPKVRGPSTMAPPAKKSGPMMDSPLTFQEQSEEMVDQGGSSLAQAVLEQSRALTALVAHMQQGDPLIDASSSSTATSSRGAQGREKLQKELAARSGHFMLTVMQNMFRRLKPAMPLPQTLDQMASTDVSMVQYLERFGGYGNCRDMGIVQYALAFIVDMAVRGDLVGIQEHLALLIVAIEQYAQDSKWELGFLLTLLEDPPPQMWAFRNPVGAQTGRVRAFAPLCPQRWATIQLAYMKEIDFIQNRRSEATKKEPNPQPAQPAPGSPNPRRRAKFPKPKAAAEPQQRDVQET